MSVTKKSKFKNIKQEKAMGPEVNSQEQNLDESVHRLRETIMTFIFDDKKIIDLYNVIIGMPEVVETAAQVSMEVLTTISITATEARKVHGEAIIPGEDVDLDTAMVRATALAQLLQEEAGELY